MDFHLGSPYHRAFLHAYAHSPLNLSGSICALATPFRAADDAIDLDALQRLIDFQIGSGTRGLVIAGSTGEGAALAVDEFAALVEAAHRTVAGRVPLLAGTGMQSTLKTIEQTRLAASAGAELALVVTPAYVRPTQEGLYRHFCEVADKGGLPVVLYNVPSRTACDLLPETVARLSTQSAIVGIKEARTEVDRMRDLVSLRSETFALLSGDDPTCARAILAGADGVISVAANVAPALMQALCSSASSGDAGGVSRLNSQLQELFDLLAVEPNPIPVKWCLQRLGFGTDHLRLPLLSLSAAYHARAERVLNEAGLLESLRSAG
jgi:4-hydroxy-tetrahydrodipicolinate synthase